MALYSLVETCEYSNLRDEMLWDRIAVGIRDTALLERLQLDSELTLEKAKKTVRQKEAVKAQHLQLRGEGTKKDPIVLDEVKGRTLPPKKRAARPFQKTGGSHQTATKPQCQCCGWDKHAPKECPARNATGHKCNWKGHFSAQCFSKTAAASTNKLSLGSAFLGTVSPGQEAAWTSTLLLGTKEIPLNNTHYNLLQKQVVVLTTWWLLQLHHVGHVGDNTITYNVEEIAYASYIN